MTKPLELKRKCTECGDEFFIIKGAPSKEDKQFKTELHQGEWMINGKLYYLTYFDCPFCGKRHFVQIDDEKSKKKLESVVKHLALASSGKGRYSAYSRVKNNLAKYRDGLEKSTSGSVLKNELTGDIYTLEFTK